MTDLKPCPFCGSDDIRREYGAGSKPPYNDPYVVCVDCGASVAGKAGAWNTRADLAAERERKLVEALKLPEIAALVGAFVALEKAASEVSKCGAQTGGQWVKLTVALLKSRLTLRKLEGGE